MVLCAKVLMHSFQNYLYTYAYVRSMIIGLERYGKILFNLLSQRSLYKEEKDGHTLDSPGRLGVTDSLEANSKQLKKKN